MSTTAITQAFPEYISAPDRGHKPQKPVVEWVRDGHSLTDTRTACIKICQAIKTFFQAIARLFISLAECIKTIFKKNEFTYYDLTKKETIENLDNHPSDKPLYVLIPGLGAPPTTWVSCAKRIKQAHKRYSTDPDIRIIRNKKNGQQDIEKTLAPILTMAQKYATVNPDARVVFIGESLGGVIASRLEVALRKSHPKNPVFIASIVGAYGSKVVSFANKVFCGNSPLPGDLGEHFAHENDHSKQLIAAQNKDLPEGCSRWLFHYAGINDTTVVPFTQQLPIITNPNILVRQHLVNGGHISSSAAAIKHVVNRAITFHDAYAV
jgi:hypothetical protein